MPDLRSSSVLRGHPLKAQLGIASLGVMRSGPRHLSSVCRYIHQGLTVSHSEAERLRADGLARVLAARRLLLVLDLDHTLLNSVRLSEVQDPRLMSQMTYRQL